MPSNFNHTMPLDEIGARLNSIPDRLNQELGKKGFLGAHAAPVVTDARGQTVAYTGEIPPDLTILDDRQLGWYLGMLSGWMDYVQRQLAIAQTHMSVSQAHLEATEAHLLMVHKKDPADGDKKRSEAERKAMVLTDRRYVEAQSEAIYHETFYRYVNAIFKAADQNYNSVSRRITQRQQDIERDKRGTNVGAKLSSPTFRTSP